ncbi:DUF4262 domain-containing protein [Actinomadura sp. WMMA1423]|uniref:DUF4262 domain-containing protein n=1 Tax=Actinomadura sp. WMMA1423 TaxID=2591108 RepID=UPI0011468C62|nr:DUF4262 domain-containing protein [Actinomadura sp. WMMA1423]
MTDPDRTSCACLIHQRNQTGDPDVDVLVTWVNEGRWTMTGDDLRAWSCTVGQWHTFRSPEFVICGLSRGERRHILVKAVIAMEYGLPKLGEVDTQLTSLKVKTVRVHQSWYGSPLLRIPRAFYGGELPEYRQLIWAEGAEGFPGDEGFDAGLLERQPDLAIPLPDHPKCVWTALR